MRSLVRSIAEPAVPGISALLLISVVGGASLILVGCGLFGGDDTNSPPTPTEVQAQSKDGAVALEWNAVDAGGLAGYRVYRAPTSISEGADPSRVSGGRPVAEAGYTDDSAQNGTTYYYVVTAVDEAGNESDPSPEVKKTPFASPPDRP
jgi:TolB protein